MTSPYQCEYAVEVLRRAVIVNEFDDEIEVPGAPAVSYTHLTLPTSDLV